MPDPELNFEALQADADRIFSERAGRILSDPLGRLAVRSIDLATRSVGHPSIITNTFLPADINRTEEELAFYEKFVGNIPRVTETIDRYWNEHSLDKYPEVIIAVDHHQLNDLLDIAHLVWFSKSIGLESGRTARDNTIPLGRMLTYATYRQWLLFGKPKDVTLDHLLPVGNLGLVIPYTPSTEDLRENHRDGVKFLARKVKNEMAEDKEARIAETSHQHITIVAPGASEMKWHQGGKIMQPIHRIVLGSLYSALKEDIPIVVMSCDLKLVPATIKRIGRSIPFVKQISSIERQKANFELQAPIVECGQTKEEFREELQNKLQTGARKVTGYSIHRRDE